MLNQSNPVKAGGFVAPSKKKLGNRQIRPANSQAQTTMSAAPTMESSASGLMGSSGAPAPTRTQTGTGTPDRYTPQDGRVQSNQLVETRLNGLMSMDNPLMQRVANNSRSLSAQRGLQSSSIATENALNAMFNYAMPIAQQDANTFTEQSQMNQQNRQRLGEIDNQFKNNQALQDDQQAFQSGENAADRGFQLDLEDRRYSNQVGLLDLQQDFQAGENQAERDNRLALEDRRAQNNLALQESQQTFQSGENQAGRDFQAVENQAGRDFQAGENQANRDLQTSENNLNLEFQRGENQADREFQLDLENQRAANQFKNNQALQDDMQAFNMDLEALRQQNSLGLLSAENQNRLQQMEMQHSQNLEQMDRADALQTDRDTLLQSFTERNIDLEGAQRILQIEAQTQQQMQLQQFQNDFARAMEYSNAVSNAVNFGIEALGNAMMNPEITPAQYQSIQDQINNMVQSNITAYQDIFAIGGDVPDQDVPPPTGGGSGSTPGGGSGSTPGGGSGSTPGGGGGPGGGPGGGGYMPQGARRGGYQGGYATQAGPRDDRYYEDLT